MKTPKSFEEGMNRLDEVLEQLNSPQTPLAQAIKAYTEAACVLEYCEGVLQKAQVQVEELSAAYETKKDGASEDGLPKEV